MLRILLVVLCAMTFAACTWPFAEAKKQSVGTDFEYEDFTPVSSADNVQGADASIAWEK